MALRASETFVLGFVREAGAIVLTTASAGATFRNGFLRDPDGRLVVGY